MRGRSLAAPLLRQGRVRSDAMDQAAVGIRGLGRRSRVLSKTDYGPALVVLRWGAAGALAKAGGAAGLQ
eukprot:13042888-Alexandrium_andersonii.AAC.1